jgi:hypothetical protein
MKHVEETKLRHDAFPFWKDELSFPGHGNQSFTSHLLLVLPALGKIFRSVSSTNSAPWEENLPQRKYILFTLARQWAMISTIFK